MTADDAVISTSASSLSPKCSLILDADIRNSKGEKIRIKVPKNAKLTITRKSSWGAIKGTKTSELVIEDDVSAQSAATFNKVDTSDNLLTVSGKSAKIKGIVNFSGYLRLDAVFYT